MENMKTYESGSTSKRFPIFEMGSLYSEAGKLKTLKTEFLKAIRKSQSYKTVTKTRVSLKRCNAC